MENRKTTTIIEEMNPTFLFTWKGIRKRDKGEDSYHKHDFVELAYILSGEGRYLIEGEVYAVKEGDLLILNPGIQHQALCCPEVESPATEFFVAFSDISLVGIPENCMMVPEGEHILHTTGELRQQLIKICTAMETESAGYRQGRYFMLKAYLMQLLLLVIREQCEPVERKSGYAFESANKKYVVEQIVNYFEDHYNEKISLDQIAENMYLSPFYISKIFKSETGDTPIRYLINIRLNKAKTLLESGFLGSIQEIASMVGYEDAYHFSKLFKKYYGITPTQARKKV